VKYLLVFAALLVGSIGFALSRERHIVIEPSVVEPYIEVAAALSGYKVPDTRPTVLAVHDTEFFADNSGGCKDCIVLGLYDINPKAPDIIYLNVEAPREQWTSTLIHELVHWLQEKNGRIADTCEQTMPLEREAYRVDALYTALFVDPSAQHYMPELTCP
jgi:hypothetical protein